MFLFLMENNILVSIILGVLYALIIFCIILFLCAVVAEILLYCKIIKSEDIEKY